MKPQKRPPDHQRKRPPRRVIRSRLILQYITLPSRFLEMKVEQSTVNEDDEGNDTSAKRRRLQRDEDEDGDPSSSSYTAGAPTASTTSEGTTSHGAGEKRSYDATSSSPVLAPQSTVNAYRSLHSLPFISCPGAPADQEAMLKMLIPNNVAGGTPALNVLPLQASAPKHLTLSHPLNKFECDFIRLDWQGRRHHQRDSGVLHSSSLLHMGANSCICRPPLVRTCDSLKTATSSRALTVRPITLDCVMTHRTSYRANGGDLWTNRRCHGSAGDHHPKDV